MYKIQIVCVGKLKEKYFIEAQDEYAKRLKKFCDFQIVELQENFLSPNPSEQEINNSLLKEYNQILPFLKGKVFVCDLNGKQFDSVEFSSKIFDQFNLNSCLTFVIGSSYGLSEKIKTNELICFSKMTFPHHLMRIFLEEQIYRAFTIKNNITYHK